MVIITKYCKIRYKFTWTKELLPKLREFCNENSIEMTVEKTPFTSFVEVTINGTLSSISRKLKLINQQFNTKV